LCFRTGRNLLVGRRRVEGLFERRILWIRVLSRDRLTQSAGWRTCSVSSGVGTIGYEHRWMTSGIGVVLRRIEERFFFPCIDTPTPTPTVAAAKPDRTPCFAKPTDKHDVTQPPNVGQSLLYCATPIETTHPHHTRRRYG
jgi:hypothetical protein